MSVLPLWNSSAQYTNDLPKGVNESNWLIVYRDKASPRELYLATVYTVVAPLRKSTDFQQQNMHRIVWLLYNMSNITGIYGINDPGGQRLLSAVH